MYPASEALIDEMKDVIVRTVDPLKIILFGSYASGTSRPNSDVDFLIVENRSFGPGCSRRKEMTKLWRQLACFMVPKDIIIYSREEFEYWRETKNHVIAHALREGRLLYERQ